METAEIFNTKLHWRKENTQTFEELLDIGPDDYFLGNQNAIMVFFP